MVVEVGIVGTGHGARVIAPALLVNPRCRLAGIAARRADTALEAAQGFDGVRAYEDWRTLVSDPRIDALVIAVPPQFQPDVAVAAMDAGKAVFLEKPLAADLPGAERIYEAARRTGRPNVMGFIFPELKPWQQVKQSLDAGEIGAARSVDVTWRVMTYANRHRLSSWKTESAQGGGTLLNFGSHVFLYLEWLLGPIERITATLGKGSGDPRPGDTQTQLALAFANGTKGNVAIDADASDPTCHRLNVAGSKGRIELANNTSDYAAGFRGTLWDGDDQERQAYSEPQLAADIDGRVAASAALIDKLMQWIETGVPSTPTAANGLRVQILLDCARRSDQEKMEIQVPQGINEQEAS